MLVFTAVDRKCKLVIIENKLDDSGKDVTWQAMTLTKLMFFYMHRRFTIGDLQFLAIREKTSEIDILDENLYSYDCAVYGLIPATYYKTSENLLSK